MEPWLLNIAGWVGAAQIIGMYFLLSTNLIKPKKIYHFFNCMGACWVCAVCIEGRVWQAAMVEAIWAVMALCFLIAQFFKKEDANVSN